MKTSFIDLQPLCRIRIINNYKGYASLYDVDESTKFTKWDLWQIKEKIEKKLECEIEMVRYDSILNVIEFYII